MRKWIALILILLLSLTGCSRQEAAAPTAAPKESTAPTAEPGNGSVAVLFTGNTLGFPDGPLSYGIIGAVKRELEKEYGVGNVLLVDGGDHSLESIPAMDTACYDLAAIGEWELTDGVEALLENRGRFPYVSCNLYRMTQGARGDTVVEPWHLFETGSLRVAFVGITAPEAGEEDGYGIAGGDLAVALQADVQANINDARDKGADIVIGLGHLGESSTPWTGENTLSSVTGMDIFLDGDGASQQKTVSDRAGEERILLGCDIRSIGLLILNSATGEIQTDYIRCTPVVEPLLDQDGNPVLVDGEEQMEITGYELTATLYTGPKWPEGE